MDRFNQGQAEINPFAETGTISDQVETTNNQEVDKIEQDLTGQQELTAEGKENAPINKLEGARNPFGIDNPVTFPTEGPAGRTEGDRNADINSRIEFARNKVEGMNLSSEVESILEKNPALRKDFQAFSEKFDADRAFERQNQATEEWVNADPARKSFFEKVSDFVSKKYGKATIGVGAFFILAGAANLRKEASEAPEISVSPAVSQPASEQLPPEAVKYQEAIDDFKNEQQKNFEATWDGINKGVIEPPQEVDGGILAENHDQPELDPQNQQIKEALDRINRSGEMPDTTKLQ